MVAVCQLHSVQVESNAEPQTAKLLHPYTITSEHEMVMNDFKGTNNHDTFVLLQKDSTLTLPLLRFLFLDADCS